MGDLLSRFRRQPPPHPPTPPPKCSLMEKAWRQINWRSSNDMKAELSKEPNHQTVENLRILLIGPVKAGKSSFIHSIQSICKNRIPNAGRLVSAGPKSFTKSYTAYTFKDEAGKKLPFVIGDVMGLESDEGCGVHPQDIINILQGHIKDEYKFDHSRPCSRNDPGYNSDPTLNDKFHCVVFVFPIDNFIANSSHETQSFLKRGLIEKIETIRETASNLKIPQVVVLTKVDLACDHLSEDIKQVYQCNTIYQKAKVCEQILGIPLSDVYPVWNYTKEPLNSNMNAMLLSTLSKILQDANEFVEERMEENSTVRPNFSKHGVKNKDNVISGTTMQLEGPPCAIVKPTKDMTNVSLVKKYDNI